MKDLVIKEVDEQWEEVVYGKIDEIKARIMTKEQKQLEEEDD